nr:hypothetical protein Iba_chr05aCG9050 [Ipomoea batatas]
MSGSDNQNISGQDYDEGDEVGNESYTPSTGGSTFDQIHEVEHISVNSGENEGPLRTPTLAEEASTSGQGKSPRVVITALFPHLSPRTVEDAATSLPHGDAPPACRSAFSPQSVACPGRSQLICTEAG